MIGAPPELLRDITFMSVFVSVPEGVAMNFVIVRIDVLRQSLGRNPYIFAELTEIILPPARR